MKKSLPWLLLAVVMALAVTDRCDLDHKRAAAIVERDEYMSRYQQNEVILKSETEKHRAAYTEQVTKIVTLEARIKELLRQSQLSGKAEQLPVTQLSSNPLQLPPLEGLSFADALEEYIRRNMQARADHDQIMADYEAMLSLKDGVIRDLYQTTNKLADIGKRRICLTVGPCVYAGAHGVGFGVSLQLGYRIW
jgi:hypothetical protein